MQRRKFGREFKIEAVRRVRERGVSVAQAARDLDVHETMLHRWVKQAADPHHAFPESGADGRANGSTAPSALRMMHHATIRGSGGTGHASNSAGVRTTAPRWRWPYCGFRFFAEPLIQRRCGLRPPQRRLLLRYAQPVPFEVVR